MRNFVELLSGGVPVAQLLPYDLIGHVLRLLIIGKRNLVFVLRLWREGRGTGGESSQRGPGSNGKRCGRTKGGTQDRATAKDGGC